MKTKTLFAGVFAVLLALAILPGAFAQQTGASPETGAEEEVVAEKAVLSDIYGYCCYGVFPRVGPFVKAIVLAFTVLGGGCLADFLELVQSATGMYFQSAIDEMSGPSPHMMPFFAGIGEGLLGCNMIEMLGGLFSGLDTICSMPIINSLCWWGWAATLLRHGFGPTVMREYFPQSYG
ncbi:MAG: hypothetical protein SVE93_03825, partial [Candidatus Thermoplasmatota archaeon]|nr:hypothetical protein [Candidatus Thermoplasmatota archaeon]